MLLWFQVSHSFHLCVLLAQSFQEMYQRKKQCSKSFAFFSKSFVAVVVTHNAVNGLDTVSLGDVNNPLN